MTHSIACLCAKVTQQVELDHHANVLNLCHCVDCRAVSGQMCTSYFAIKTEPQLEGLEQYDQSNRLSRYFCGTCGSHVFAYSRQRGRFFAATGLIESPPQSASVRHWSVSDTLDGGLSFFLSGDVPRDSSCWLDSQSGGPESEGTKSARPSEDSAHLLVQCHCRGIELYITSPSSTSEVAWSPWPDLVVPYNSPASAANEEDVKWWLCAEKTKYLAGTCACRTCRLASGFPIQTWAFIPKSNILDAQRSELVFGVGTMKQYESSPHVYREFCSRCGASIFWHCKERPLLIDVSVGLLRADSGSRAEEWLEWFTGRTSFSEMAVDKSLIQLLEAGLKSKAASRSHPFDSDK